MPEPSTITFYVKRGGKTSTYTADPGMTWSAFVKSSYNKDNFRIPDTIIIPGDISTMFLWYNGKMCDASDTIISGATYEFMSD